MKAISSRINADALTELQSWVGRAELRVDEITSASMRGLAATLDRLDPDPASGTVLPSLWHWLYFLPQARQGEIDADGHPKRGGFLPPVPLPRRMWAGGRLRWSPDNMLRVGDAVRRESHIESITHKSGHTGDLIFVVLNHHLHNEHGLALTEAHDLVYRAASSQGQPASPPVVAKKGALWQREIVPDDVLLFRYSALTFNGHRIHYDRRYATEVEGYPGLIVHGPLIATLLVDLLRRNWPHVTICDFTFKAVRPTFDLHPFRVNGQPSADGKTVRLWSEDHDGWLTMQAIAHIA